MKILAISGSLRAASQNSALLRAVASIAPPEITIVLFSGLDDFPWFNPDLNDKDYPAVAKLQRELMAADAVLIACPEYAHGVPGVLKNALDWMVGDFGFVNKPVALLNASPRASHAQASLAEILKTMSARLVEQACISVPILGSSLDEVGIVSDPQISVALRDVLRVLQGAVEYQTETGI